MTGQQQMERRAACEWRAAGRRLEGYAAVWDAIADLGNVRETVRRGAFSKSLGAGADILGLVDHDASKLLGRTKTGSLRLAEDDRGLSFALELPDTTLGRDILALAGRGDLGGMSIGFRIPPDGARWQGRTRELVQVDLAEVSVVHSWPAYAATTVEARARMDDATRGRLAIIRARLP